ncbi:MAG: hypothetical protein LBT68_03925 [Spirochaetales bacterium]|jgi:lipoate-protein ligase A|nr:hypothetical protein [Spirochaetales bacterium]
MEVIIQEMDLVELPPIFNIPAEMQNCRVEVTIRPVPAKQETTEERIKNFREKYTHESFIQHLKQKVAEGFKFEFDVQKIIDGTETEEEKQERYRKEKRAWSDNVAERINRGEL